MVILKFTLALFLAALTVQVSLRQNPGKPQGGPYFYADPEGHPNPVQPRFRLTPVQAWRSQRHIKAYFDNRGRLVLERHMEGKEERYRVEYLWTKEGRLRRRWASQAGQVFSYFEAPPLYY